MKRNCFLTALLLAALTLPVSAAKKNYRNNSNSTQYSQGATATSGSSASTASSSSATWTGTFGSIADGAVCLRLDQIVSVSIHNYMLNGTIPITELTIDTTGNNSIRIYSFMTPDEFKGDIQKTIAELKKEAEQAGSIPQVAKQYPETTHVHCIEYSVFDSEELEGIYSSLTKAMATGKSASYSITK